MKRKRNRIKLFLFFYFFYIHSQTIINRPYFERVQLGRTKAEIILRKFSFAKATFSFLVEGAINKVADY